MDRTETIIDASPDEVWATLADPSTFADWVVGCKEVRAVEGDWPAAGSAIHHTVGVAAATIEDVTSVEHAEPGRILVLRARARPAGIATVKIVLEPTDNGATSVTMDEGIVDGPASHVPDAVTDTLLHPRNIESLRRLKRLAEDRAQQHGR